MGITVLIVAESGAGKTASLRNLPPEAALQIQVNRKSLPFSSKDWKPITKDNPNGSVIVTDNYNKITKILDRAVELGKKQIIIDDSNYLMSNENMRRVEEKGYTKFTEMAKAYWALIMHAQNLPDDVRVYFFSHAQTDAYGKSKPKTIGKMLDEVICIEGLFTIVMSCNVADGRHFFQTKTNGNDCVKTPMGMFKQSEIDNCLKLVDETICEYEGIE